MQGGAEKAGGSSAVRCGGRGRMAVTGEAHQEGDCRARPPLSSWLTVAATLFFSATLSTRILPLLPLWRLVLVAGRRRRLCRCCHLRRPAGGWLPQPASGAQPRRVRVAPMAQALHCVLAHCWASLLTSGSARLELMAPCLHLATDQVTPGTRLGSTSSLQPSKESSAQPNSRGSTPSRRANARSCATSNRFLPTSEVI